MPRKINQYITPAEVRRMTNEELRKEYSRLRAIANKRIDRLWDAGLIDYTPKFPKMRGMSMSDIGAAAADAARYLRDPRHTVTGARKFINDEINELHSRGYDFINASNFNDFTRFMENMREKVGAKVFDSGDAVDVYNEAQRLKIPSNVLEEHFDYFLEHYDSMENIKPVKTNRRISFSDISRKIRRYER